MIGEQHEVATLTCLCDVLNPPMNQLDQLLPNRWQPTTSDAN